MQIQIQIPQIQIQIMQIQIRILQIEIKTPTVPAMVHRSGTAPPPVPLILSQRRYSLSTQSAVAMHISISTNLTSKTVATHVSTCV